MSSSDTHARAIETRTYRLGKRAEKQDHTRRQSLREDAVDLHSSLGPARTTVSQIADRGWRPATYLLRAFSPQRGTLSWLARGSRWSTIRCPTP